MEQVHVKGISHITGGGFYENIPRSLPMGLTARIEEKAIQTPPIFDVIQRAGDISRRDMFNTFNMGVGMVVTVSAKETQKALDLLPGAYLLGEVVEGEERVVFA